MSNPAYIVPPLIAVVTALFLLALALFWSRRDFTSGLFCSFLVSIAVWNLLVFGQRTSPDTQHAVYWSRAMIVPSVATFVLYYHFSLIYTGTRGQKWLLRAAYLCLILFAALAPTGIFIESMRIEDFGYAPNMGMGSYLLLPVGPLLIIGGAINLLRGYKLCQTHEERQRLVYLAIAAAFPLVGGLIDAFSNLPPVAVWSNFVFCILCSIAVLRYHLLDVRIFIRRSLVYLLVSAVVAIPYVSILLLVNRFWGPIANTWWVYAIMLLFLAIILRPLYGWAQSFVDRLFYRDRYDYLKALEQFSRKAPSIVKLKELSSTLTRLVSNALRTSNACLLLPSESNNSFVIASSTGLGSLPPKIVLKNNSLLIKWLKLQQRILSFEELNIVPQLQSLSPREKNNLEQIGAKLYIPISTAPDQLSGILVLGQKLSQQPYSSEDKQLLIALSRQMAIALENARLYAVSQKEVAERKRAEEELRRSHEQLRNLSSHIESVRETERTSIAREVHDELGQALTALKMDLSWMNKRLPKEQKILIRKTEEMSNLIGTTIQTVKRISTELRPQVLDDLGLIAAIEWQVQEFQERTRIKCELTAESDEINLDRDLATAVFRILQEALTNVARHANATRVEVSLKKGDEQLVLQVRDNGKGITAKQIANPKSFGLIGMRERVRSWDGSVKIDGISGKGTTVTVSIPLKREEGLDDKNTSRR